MSTFEWTSSTPDEQDVRAENIAAMWADIEKRGTEAFMVIRNDRIVFEGYAEGWNRRRRHSTASLAKALVGGVPLI